MRINIKNFHKNQHGSFQKPSKIVSQNKERSLSGSPLNKKIVLKALMDEVQYKSPSKSIHNNISPSKKMNITNNTKY